MRALTAAAAALFLLGFTACSQDRGSEQARAMSPTSPQDPQIAELYNRSCRSCHAVGGTGAPRTGDSQAWAGPVAKGRDTLLDNTIGGYKGMPPMGMCMDCSEEDFVALIEFMAQTELD